MRRRVAIAVGTLLAIASAIGVVVARRSIDRLGTIDGIEGGAGGGFAPTAIDGDASDAAGAAARAGLAGRPRATTAPPKEREDRLTGRVVDHAGAPVADARVLDIPATITKAFELDDVGHEDLLVADAVTGADGRFTVAARGDTPIHALIARTSTGAIGCLTDVAVGRDVTIVVEGGGSIAGTVSDRDGRPIDRARIVLDGVLDALHLRYEATTRTDGTYRIDGIPVTPPGLYSDSPFRSLVEVRAEGFAPLLQYGSPTPMSSAQIVERNFVLSRGSIVEGTVADAETKAPVVGARAVLWSNEGGPDVSGVSEGWFLGGGGAFSSFSRADARNVDIPIGHRILTETRSDEEGAFRFEHVPGLGFHELVSGANKPIGGVTVIGKGLAPVSERFYPRGDDERQRIALETRSSAVVEGRVVAPPGIGCDRFVVGWVPKGASKPRSAWLPADLFPGVLDGRVGRDGRYRIDGIPVVGGDGSDLLISASLDETSNPPSATIEVRARPGEVVVAPDLVPAEVTPLRQHTIATVVDEARRPIWGALIFVERLGLASTTDREGVARMRLPEDQTPQADGTFVSIVSGDGFAATTFSLTLGASSSSAPPTIVLRGGRRIAGRVLRADGRPASGASVHVASGRHPLATVFDRTDGSVFRDGRYWRVDAGDVLPRDTAAQTDAEGRFSIADLPAGTYHLRAVFGADSVLPGGGAEIGTVSGIQAGDSDVSILLGPRTAPEPGRVVGTVRVGATGLAPRDLHVELRLASGGSIVTESADGRQLWPPSGLRYTCELAGPGRFGLDDVPPGAHRLRITSEGHDLRELDVVVEAGGTSTVPPVDLDPGVVVHGHARLAVGVELGDGCCVAVVPVAPRGERGDDLVYRTAPIAADGTFDIGGLAPGSWRLLVAGPSAHGVFAPAERRVFAIPEGAKDVSWEDTLVVATGLTIATSDPRLPQRIGGNVVGSDEQRAFAEGCEVVVIDERGDVVARQKGRFDTGDDSAVSRLLLSPGTYTVRTQLPGDPPKEERVTLVAGESKHVTFGQPPAPPAPGQTDCGKGKCG